MKMSNSALSREKKEMRVKERDITAAYCEYARGMAVTLKLYDHTCRQIQKAYDAKCEEHKMKMKQELQKEIKQLQQARDGVSVVDRRRTKRHVGNSVATNICEHISDGESIPGENEKCTAKSFYGRNGEPFVGVMGEARALQVQKPLSHAMTDTAREQELLGALLEAEFVFQPLKVQMDKEDIATDIRRMETYVKRKRENM